MLTITISTRAAIIAAVTLLFGIAAVPFAISRAEGDSPATAGSRALVPSEFIYQGRLEQDGVPANGTRTLGFTLYSDAVANSVVGNPITAVMQVTDGLFTVPLDFGDAAFNGDARWLGVEVLVGNNFVPVGNRQQLRATPYALHSLTTGPHSHFGESWVGDAQKGLAITNSGGVGLSVSASGSGVSASVVADGGSGVFAFGSGTFAKGVFASASGTNSQALRAEAVGTGAVGIQATGTEWAGDFYGWLRVSGGIRVDDVLPTYPAACGGGGCYIGDTNKAWTAVYALSYPAPSDSRLKRDITGLPYGLAEILALRPVSYSFIEDESAKTRLGLIAQEVEQVLPEVVTPPASEDAFYAMSYDDLIPVLIKAIQELDAKVGHQAAEIEALKLAAATP